MQELEAVLRRAGVKPTRHRLSVLGALCSAAEPLSAEQVYMALREGGVQINLSSVYRALELLHEKGLLTRMSAGSEGRALYEPSSAEHRHNLICSQCHRAIPIPGCPLHGYEQDIAREMQFDVTGHRIEIYGVCKDCRQQRQQ